MPTWDNYSSLDNIPNQYVPGTLVQINVQFYNTINQLVDPTTIELRVIDPTGVETDYSTAIVRLGVGQYYCNVGPAWTPGNWNYRWEGTGNIVAVGEQYFVVQPSIFSQDAS